MAERDQLGIRVDFTDEASIDRVQRAIVMLTAQAVDRLKGLGYKRGRQVDIDVHPDGLPVNVTLRGSAVYVIDFAYPDSENPTLRIEGEWVVDPPKLGFWSRLFRR